MTKKKTTTESVADSLYLLVMWSIVWGFIYAITRVMPDMVIFSIISFWFLVTPVVLVSSAIVLVLVCFIALVIAKKIILDRD
jgi:hypothetical protein